MNNSFRLTKVFFLIQDGSKPEEDLVDGESPVALELVEKPDLHHETFEALWRKLAETYVQRALNHVFDF